MGSDWSRFWNLLTTSVYFLEIAAKPKKSPGGCLLPNSTLLNRWTKIFNFMSNFYFFAWEARELARGRSCAARHFFSIVRGARGAEHRSLGLPSYPCARLRSWSRQTFWQYPLGTTLLFRQYPGYCTDLISTTAWVLKWTRDYEAMLARPPNSPRASAKPSCNSPRRVRKRSNNCDCYSEKQVDRVSGKAFALPGYGGLRRSGRSAVQDSLRLKNRLHSRNRSIVFGPEIWTIINNRSPRAQFLSTHRSDRLHGSSNLYQQSPTARSIFEHAPICSPS